MVRMFKVQGDTLWDTDYMPHATHYVQAYKLQAIIINAYVILTLIIILIAKKTHVYMYNIEDIQMMPINMHTDKKIEKKTRHEIIAKLVFESHHFNRLITLLK